jgi:hypothetical protein
MESRSLQLDDGFPGVGESVKGNRTPMLMYEKCGLPAMTLDSQAELEFRQAGAYMMNMTFHAI